MEKCPLCYTRRGEKEEEEEKRKEEGQHETPAFGVMFLIFVLID